MDFALTSTVAVALITGLVEVAKRCGLPSRYAALLAVAIGLVVYASYALSMGADAREAWELVMTGILVGLSSAGIYSGTKAVRGG